MFIKVSVLDPARQTDIYINSDKIIRAYYDVVNKVYVAELDPLPLPVIIDKADFYKLIGKKRSLKE